MSDKGLGQSKGVGFVHYLGRKSAVAAMAALNGIVLAGSTEPLVVKVSCMLQSGWRMLISASSLETNLLDLSPWATKCL